MRRVKVYENLPGAVNFIGIGFFHQFGIDYVDFDGEPGHCTTAIVEMEKTGEVRSVRADMIQFIDPPEVIPHKTDN